MRGKGFPKRCLPLQRATAINTPCPNCGNDRVSLHGHWVCKNCTRITLEEAPAGYTPLSAPIGEVFPNRAARRAR